MQPVLNDCKHMEHTNIPCGQNNLKAHPVAVKLPPGVVKFGHIRGGSKFLSGRIYRIVETMYTQSKQIPWRAHVLLIYQYHNL